MAFQEFAMIEMLEMLQNSYGHYAMLLQTENHTVVVCCREQL
jgi:hypothetical protein